MDGKELRQALELCDDQCQECKLYRPKDKYKCTKVWCEAWQGWADKQRIVFHDYMDELGKGEND